MTLATQTWQLSAEYGITIAGASATVAELLTAINGAFVAHNTAGGNLWQVSAYSAANGTLEIKRKGTHSGTLANARILFHGRTSLAPHASCVSSEISGASQVLYVGIAPEAATTGPPTLPTAGVPYVAGAYWSRSIDVCTGGEIVPGGANKILIVESDKVCCVLIRGVSGGMAVACAGECVEKLSNNTGIWACFTSRGYASASSIMMNATNNNPCPCAGYYSGQFGGIYSDAGAISVFGRCVSVPVGTNELTPFSGGSCAVTIPIHVASRGEGGSTVPVLLGCLRQIRMGPYNQGSVQIFNTGAVLQGYQINGGGAVGAGLIFDLSA